MPSHAKQNDRFVVRAHRHRAAAAIRPRGADRLCAGRVRDRQSAARVVRRYRHARLDRECRHARPSPSSATIASPRRSTGGAAMPTTFTVAYVVRAVSPGSYVLPQAVVEDMYRPDRFGRTGTGRGRDRAGEMSTARQTAANAPLLLIGEHDRCLSGRSGARLAVKTQPFLPSPTRGEWVAGPRVSSSLQSHWSGSLRRLPAAWQGCSKPSARRRSGAISKSRPSLLDRNGKLLRAYLTSEGRWRLPATRKEVDPRFLEALLAYEDKRFFDHRGVDPLAFAARGATSSYAWPHRLRRLDASPCRSRACSSRA